MEPNDQGNGTVVALMGCGALLMVGLCVVTSVGAYLFLSPAAPPAAPIVVAPSQPAPLPPQPIPEPIPQPTPPPPQPPQPQLPPPPGPPRSPLRVRATVTFITPGGPVASGASCDFRVLFPEAQTCRAQVYCGGRLLYGGESAGYFPCTPGPGAAVTGQDGNTTSTDTDASFSISTAASIITIRDDASGANGAFTLTARVDSVQ